MNYTVIWTPTAEQDLAAAWLASSDRNAVTAASQALDVMLKRDPVNLGESRYDSLRIAFASPLGIDFDVSEDDRTVYVLAVWLI